MFYICTEQYSSCGFPGSAVVKNLPANAGGARDVGLIPRSGRSPGGGYGNPLHFSCQENPMDRGNWWAIVHGDAESDTTEQLRINTHAVATSYNWLWAIEKRLVWLRKYILNLSLYSREWPGCRVEGTAVDSSSLEHQRVRIWQSCFTFTAVSRVWSNSEVFFPQQPLETSWSLSGMMAVTAQCTWSFHTISLTSSQKSFELSTIPI